MDHLGDTLSALLDGELPGPQEVRANAHLVSCPTCAEELHAVRQARAWVRALPPVDAPFGFYERILLGRAVPGPSGRWSGIPGPSGIPSPSGPWSGVPGQGGFGGMRRRAGMVALGAAAAAVTVLGVGSPSQTPAPPASTRLVQARATSASVGVDLLSKLAPVGVPGSFGR